MEVKKCFELGCKQEAEYICKCVSPGTYSCELHVGKHLKLRNKNHAFESIFVDSYKETKEEILKILIEKITKYNKLKEMLLASFNQHLLNSESYFEELMKVLDKSSDELKHYFFKISEAKTILKTEQDPILGLLCLQPQEAIEKIKVLMLAHSNWFENAEEELRVFSTLNNPYIICLGSYFKVESKTHRVLKESSLLKAIADKQLKNQYFDEEEIWKYFIQISFGLEALHSKGYIHRDIKPENILLDENKDVKLVDFGLSIFLQTSPFKASPPYFSPEMRNGDLPAKESDIWALGCVLWYLCSLEDPFKENKQKTQNDLYEVIKPQYSQELRYFISWCLKENKNERPTINDIISHEFVINKALSLGLTIPETSSASTIYRELFNVNKRKNLKVESKCLELSNEIIDQKAEIDRLKSEIASLENTIIEKYNYIEVLRSQVIELANLFENYKKTLNEKFVNSKMVIKSMIADVENFKKMLDYSENDLNWKELSISQSKNNRTITMQNLMEKRSEVLNSFNNPKLEKIFRITCSAYEKNYNAHDASVMLAYQDYVNIYHQKTSLFNLVDKHGITNLLIYNTETEAQEWKKLQISVSLGFGACITQLPNGKLFCCGVGWRHTTEQMTLLIDENYNVEEFPNFGLFRESSAIYFKGNIYCFGGIDHKCKNISIRFDLTKNKWNDLTPMPERDHGCSTVIFNESILISGYVNHNLLRYSIDSNSFTAILYDFAEHKRKILLNAERLYLIEYDDNSSIYESDIGSDTAWRWIANDSTINFYPNQVYCVYNKEGIYIGCARDNKYACFKFNLNEKRLIKLFENEV